MAGKISNLNYNTSVVRDTQETANASAHGVADILPRHPLHNGRLKSTLSYCIMYSVSFNLSTVRSLSRYNYSST